MATTSDNMRDEIAFEVMKILFEHRASNTVYLDIPAIASEAYRMADAMIAERGMD